MVTALDSGPGGPGSSPGQAHFAEFLGKTIYSISASLHQSVSIRTGKFTAGGNPTMDKHPIQVGEEVLLVA